MSGIVRFASRKGILAGSLLLALNTSAWAASTFYIDQFSVTLNGTAIFTDDFSDNVAPPSSPTYLVPTGATNPPGYSLVGTYFTGSESNGLLKMSIANGVSTLTASGHPAFLQQARLQTPIATGSNLRLGSEDTFKVSAKFNYVNPDGPTEAFHLDLNDRVTPQGPGDTTNDVVRLMVMRAQFAGKAAQAINPATNEPFGKLNGQVIVGILKSDFVKNTDTWYEAHAVDVTGKPDQIRLTLEKKSNASLAITGSFTYLKNGVDLSTTILTSTVNAFSDENFTRAQFNAFQLERFTTAAAAKLTTGSPAGISQTVDKVTSSNLQFSYRFATTGGKLTVTLNGVELGVIDAPTTLSNSFSVANFNVPAELLNALLATLTFTLDGLTGSSILLDNIIFAGLANGDFQTGNLSGWQPFSSGAGSVGVQITVTETPLPAALPLFATVLAAGGLVAWRRKRKQAAAAV